MTVTKKHTCHLLAILLLVLGDSLPPHSGAILGASSDRDTFFVLF